MLPMLEAQTKLVLIMLLTGKNFNTDNFCSIYDFIIDFFITFNTTTKNNT